MWPNSFHLCSLTLWLIGFTLQRSYRSGLLIFSGQWTPIMFRRCFLCIILRLSRFCLVRPHVPQLYRRIGITSASYSWILFCSPILPFLVHMFFIASCQSGMCLSTHWSAAAGLPVQPHSLTPYGSISVRYMLW